MNKLKNMASVVYLNLMHLWLILKLQKKKILIKIIEVKVLVLIKNKINLISKIIIKNYYQI